MTTDELIHDLRWNLLLTITDRSKKVSDLCERAERMMKRIKWLEDELRAANELSE